jgi:hypothetical protein
MDVPDIVQGIFESNRYKFIVIPAKAGIQKRTLRRNAP